VFKTIFGSFISIFTFLVLEKIDKKGMFRSMLLKDRMFLFFIGKFLISFIFKPRGDKDNFRFENLIFDGKELFILL